MKTRYLLFVPLAGLAAWLSWPTAEAEKADVFSEKHAPADHFFLQRSYPDTTFAVHAYEAALQAARQDRAAKSGDGFDADWVSQGPGNIGGRINTVVVHPGNADIIYAGCATGGVFKTTDGGQNWNPIFDDQPFLAIGHISLDPNNPNIVYVGTGDVNISGYPFLGDGVYRSTDAGATWTHLGLADQRIIAKVFASPRNGNTLFAATMGIPFERNTDRGLYKSTDGGLTWQQKLFITSQTGTVDLLIDPIHPDTLYTASWDRIRNNQESTADGPNAGVWRSTDEGETWAQLTNGLPSGDFSRVGICMSGLNPQTVFALYVGTNYQTAGIFKSTNAGSSWAPVPIATLDSSALGGFGWYFGKIAVNPADDDEIYVLGVDLHRSTDGGTTWQEATPPWWQYSVHADKHDLQFVSSDHLVLATDGGLYASFDRSQNWLDIENIPNTQFYRVAVNPHTPGTYYGGAQDNGSMGGNAAGFNNWERILGGDGFQMRFDKDISTIWYAQTQNGRMYVSTDAGNSFNGHNDGVDDTDRRNWDAPFVLSSQYSDVQYTGTYRVYRNLDGANTNWAPISDDLTDGLVLHPRFHNISALGVSDFDYDIVYAGTSDGNVWTTPDGGTNWQNISSGLPDRYVTSVNPSPVDQATVFVSHSGYKDNEFIPHVHRSSNNGQTWTDISGDLPQLAVNNIAIWPFDDNLLFVATDGGVYGTVNGGLTWSRLGANMPVMPVYDIEIDTATRELVAGTHARSLMTYPLDSILNNLSPPTAIDKVAEQTLRVYPNPATDRIRVELPQDLRMLSLEILDLNGRVWKRQDLREEGVIELGGLPAGVYVVKGENVGRRFVGRFVKE